MVSIKVVDRVFIDFDSVFVSVSPTIRHFHFYFFLNKETEFPNVHSKTGCSLTRDS